MEREHEMREFKDMNELLTYLTEIKYYGKVEISLQAGKIVRCEKHDSIKFTESK